jgi:hypothetical protein
MAHRRRRSAESSAADFWTRAPPSGPGPPAPGGRACSLARDDASPSVCVLARASGGRPLPATTAPEPSRSSDSPAARRRRLGLLRRDVAAGRARLAAVLGELREAGAAGAGAALGRFWAEVAAGTPLVEPAPGDPATGW